MVLYPVHEARMKICWIIRKPDLKDARSQATERADYTKCGSFHLGMVPYAFPRLRVLGSDNPESNPQRFPLLTISKLDAVDIEILLASHFRGLKATICF